MQAFPAIPADNLQYYDFPQRFREFVAENRQRPVEDRPPCRDAVCLVFLIIALGGFFGYGGYIINLTRINSIPLVNNYLFNDTLSKYAIGYTLGMIALSVGLSLVMIVLLRFCPMAGLWTLIVMTLAVLAGLTIVCFYYGMTGPGITVAILLAVMVLMVICYSQKIGTMGQVLKTITMFLQERKRIFITTFGILSLAVGFLAFWIISYYCMYALSSLGITSETDYTTGFVCWIVLGVFWNFWFYYLMVYLIGAQTALWYYESLLTPIMTPLKWLLQGSLGSVTFGALLLAVIKAVDIVLSISLNGRRNREQSIGNAIFRCCVCMLQCCLRSVYTFIKILNNFNMIVISFTGQSYMDSARLTGYIILKNFDMFQLFKLTSYFVYTGGLVTVSGIPTFIGLYLFNRDGLPYNQVVVYGAIIFCFSLLIGIVVFATLMQAVNAMFVIFCFENSAGKLGHRINSTAARTNQLDDHYRQALPAEMSSYNDQPQVPTQEYIGNQVYNPNPGAYPPPYMNNQRLTYDGRAPEVNNPRYDQDGVAVVNNQMNYPLGFPL